MTTNSFAGGCFCGAIRFTVIGATKICCFCHCESCRRASGGAYVPWATFEAAAVQITRGELALCASSAEVTRGHCARCGTALTYAHAKRPDEVDIAVVAFDDPAVFSPTCHIWVDDKLPWVSIHDGLPQHCGWATAENN